MQDKKIVCLEEIIIDELDKIDGMNVTATEKERKVFQTFVNETIKSMSYIGNFSGIYSDIISWSQGEEVEFKGIPEDFSGILLVTPEEVLTGQEPFDKYFLVSKKSYDIAAIGSKCVFDLDNDIFYNFFYKTLMGKPELNEIISKYDLQKAVGKSFKSAYFLGMACPVMLVLHGKLLSVSIGGFYSHTYCMVFNDAGIFDDASLDKSLVQDVVSLKHRLSKVHSSFQHGIEDEDIAKEYTILSVNKYQHQRMRIIKEDNTYKLFNALLTADSKHYYFTNVNSLLSVGKPAELEYILECLFSFRGFQVKTYGGNTQLHISNKGTPLFIDRTLASKANTVELTRDLTNLVVESFTSDTADSMSSFLYDKDVYRVDKKTDANRYTKETCAPFFSLRRNEHSKSMTENKSYSNFIRKSLYSLENLVASIIFYADTKSPDSFFMDEDKIAQIWSGRAGYGYMKTSQFKTYADFIPVISKLLSSVSITSTVVEDKYLEFKKYPTISKFKNGLFDYIFFQTNSTNLVELRFLTGLFSNLHNRSSRYFKSEKDFYIYDLVTALYQATNSKDGYQMVQDFYIQNCTPCIPELDNLVSLGAKNLQYFQRKEVRSSVVEISTVFNLSLDHVEILKQVISLNRASEYQAFLETNKVALQTIIYNLKTSALTKTNLSFALEFLCEWTKRLDASEKLYIAKNPHLLE